MRRATLLVVLITLLVLLAASPAVAAPRADDVIHTVQPGENLFRIGLRYGVSWSSIMEANGLGSTYIYTGQQLLIPAVSGPVEPSVTFINPGTYTVAPGDTIGLIARRYGVSVAALTEANNLPDNRWVFAGQTLTIPGGETAPAPEAPAPEPEPEPVVEPVAITVGTYIVQGGDTLWAIAQRHGVTAEALATANQLPATGWVYAGQTLTIPGTDGTVIQPALEQAAPAAGAVEAPPVATGAVKRILVDISDQRLFAFQDGALVYDFIASTGSPGLDTRPGNYSVLDKIPNAYGGTWNIWMPHWLGIYWAGSLQNGIHSLPILPGGGRLWEGWLGTPVSYGCVILGIWEAETIYNWAEVGIPVDIQW